MSVQDLANDMKARVEGGAFEASIKFDCGEDGVLVIDHQSVSTTDQEADCTVGVSLEDLEAIVAGDLDPTAAFMQGKLKVEGDMAVAMKLSQLL